MVGEEGTKYDLDFLRNSAKKGKGNLYDINGILNCFMNRAVLCIEVQLWGIMGVLGIKLCAVIFYKCEFSCLCSTLFVGSLCLT